MRTKQTLALSDARTLATACRDRSQALSARVSIAVVDDAGALLYFMRMDGARAYSVDLAIRKARTSAAFALPTRVLQERTGDRPLQGQDLLLLPGGAPVMSRNECVGAAGVAGASPEDDERIVLAGVAALAT